MKISPSRERVYVKLVTGEEYRFITELDSDIKTQWLCETDEDYLRIFNNNGKALTFLRSSVLCFNENTYPSISEICKEISPNIFEINDYLKAD